MAQKKKFSRKKSTKKTVLGRPPTSVTERIEEKHFDLEIIRKLSIHGFTDVELGDILGVDERTINRWKKDPAFMSALTKGKVDADNDMELSLHKKGMGFEYTEIQIEGTKKPDGSIAGQRIRKTTKYYPPDTAAAFIWLKNRRPDKWKDRVTIDHSGRVINQNIDFTKLTREQLERIRAGEDPAVVLATESK